MKPIRLLLYVFAAQLLITACQKELNFDVSTISSGGLMANISRDCSPSTVNGVFHIDSSFNSNHYIDVQVNAVTAGTYLVKTDTVNGYSFKGEGILTATGLNMIRLYPSGHPINEGIDTFIVNYGTSTCSVKVTVAGHSTGYAVYTLGGAPGACTGVSASGIYQAGVSMTPSNFIQLDVNVTLPGIYSLAVVGVNGMSFSGSGVFINTGLQSVTLQASGTPVTAGPVNLEVTNPATSESCLFTIVVLPAGTGSAVYTFESSSGACSGAVANGTYQVGVAATGSNTVTLQVNVATAGTYTMSTNAVNGISFSGAGNFSATGVQPVVLTASGTPAAAGTSYYNISDAAATTSCSFTVTAIPAGPGASAVFTLESSAGVCSGAVVNGTYEAGVGVNASLNTVTVNVNVTTIGTYSISTNVVNGLYFSGSGSFTATGVQPVILSGSGTAAASGTSNYTVTAGTSTCTFSLLVNTGNATSQLYIPMTTNSNWTYTLQGGMPWDTTHIGVLSNSISLSGNSYRIFRDRDSFDSTFFRLNGSKYYTFQRRVEIFNVNPDLDVMILDTSLSVNATWSNDLGSFIINGNQQDFRTRNKILQKGATETIGSTIYNNIIKVETVYDRYTTGTGWVSYDIVENWYARGYGLIYSGVTDFQFGAQTIYKATRVEIY